MGKIIEFYVFHWRRAFCMSSDGVPFTALNVLKSFNSLLTIMLFHKVVIFGLMVLVLLVYYAYKLLAG